MGVPVNNKDLQPSESVNNRTARIKCVVATMRTRKQIGSIKR